MATFLTMSDLEGTPPPPAEEQSPPPPPAATHTGSPTDFLKGVVGKRVIVRLTSGVDYCGMCIYLILNFHWVKTMSKSGVLSCLDGYMNIAMEQTEEQVNGRVTNSYGDAFIRGNNGDLTPHISALLFLISPSFSLVHISCRRALIISLLPLHI